MYIGVNLIEWIYYDTINPNITSCAIDSCLIIFVYRYVSTKTFTFFTPLYQPQTQAYSLLRPRLNHHRSSDIFAYSLYVNSSISLLLSRSISPAMLRELSLLAKRRSRERHASATPKPPSASPSPASSSSSLQTSSDTIPQPIVTKQPSATRQPSAAKHASLNSLKASPSRNRGLVSLPRRLSRGPSYANRSTSLLSSRRDEEEREQPESSSAASVRRFPSERRSSRVQALLNSSERRLEKQKQIQQTPPPRAFPRKPGFTAPLLSVDDLIKWRPSGIIAKCVSKVPLSEAAINRYVKGTTSTTTASKTTQNPGSRVSRIPVKKLQPPRLLLCHDFKDAYHPWEASAAGVFGDDCPADTDMWRFNHWAYVDIFVYFSHYCVTIPPVGYVHAAHRHGSLALGTLIFEHEQGLLELQKILASFKTRSRAASQLAAIAKFYGFDGWLVNVEVALPGGSSSASDLAVFVAELTRTTRKVLGPVSEVVWYDSVTRDGSLAWQNELNADNDQFFKAAGSIFTNYHWDRNAPVRSSVKAGTRRTDVFTGIDVHGRNTFGGGGFQTHIALRAIKQGGTSAAIFAPAWTVETCPPNVEDPRELEERFWTGPSARFGRDSISQYFKERPVLTQLPFETYFDPGWGPRLMRNGKVKDNRRYFNMSLQQIQPSFMRSSTAAGDSTATEMSLSHEEAYNGSASIKTSFSFSESRMLTGSFSILRLFIANVVFPTRLSSRVSRSEEGTINVSYDYMIGSESESDEAGNNFGIVLLFASPPTATFLVGPDSLWARANDGPRRLPRLQILGKFINVDICVAHTDRRAFGAPLPEEGKTAWMTRSFTLESEKTSGQRMSEVMMVVGGPPQQPVSVRPSPFMSPSGSRSASRRASRYSSRVGSRVASRQNSPPPEHEENPVLVHSWANESDPAPDEEIENVRTGSTIVGDDFGKGLLSQYRESFGTRRLNTTNRNFSRRTSDVREEVSRPISAAFERREESAPSMLQRRTGPGLRRVFPEERKEGIGRLSGYSGYASNFQVEGTIDYRRLDMDDGLKSGDSSRVLSRVGSRLQTPMGSRPISRYGSTAVSLSASRTGSVSNSRIASRRTSRQGSRYGSPTRTPVTGGGGAVPIERDSLGVGKPLPGPGFRRRPSALESGVESGVMTPRSGAALRDLKTALMFAAGSMAGEQAPGQSVGKKMVIFLGGLRITHAVETNMEER